MQKYSNKQKTKFFEMLYAGSHLLMSEFGKKFTLDEINIIQKYQQIIKKKMEEIKNV